jgi:hypothetical protein
VLAVLRVNIHLERMADYCVTVAKLTKLMGGLDVSDDHPARARGDGSACRADDPRRPRRIRHAFEDENNRVKQVEKGRGFARASSVRLLCLRDE